MVEDVIFAPEVAQPVHPHLDELLMRDRQDDRVIGVGIGLADWGDAVFVLGFGGIGPRIVNNDFDAIILTTQVWLPM